MLDFGAADVVACELKRVRPFCICFYCICCGARGVLRRILYPFRRVTAHASRNSANDSEGECKRGLVTVVHRVNYTIFAASRVALCGGFLPRLVLPRQPPRGMWVLYQIILANGRTPILAVEKIALALATVLEGNLYVLSFIFSR